jgi:hypothetical protein
MKKLNLFNAGCIPVFVLFIFMTAPLPAQQHESGNDPSKNMAGGQQPAAVQNPGPGETKSGQTGAAVKEDTTAAEIYYYTCPMAVHKNVHSDQPGNCPQCGMRLVAAVAAAPDSADYYGCPMPEHSYVRQDKPGRCPICHMELKPMRFKAQS